MRPYLFSRHQIGVVHGIQCDGTELSETNFSLFIENGFISAEVDDLAHKTASVLLDPAVFFQESPCPQGKICIGESPAV